MKSNVQSVYNKWAESYDEMENKTRDLDKKATRFMLGEIVPSIPSVLELGCGTGKNTEWLIDNAKQVVAVDLSEEMLEKAKQKFSADNLVFKQADITVKWPFEIQSFSLITCNLILEHVQNLDFIFSEAARVLQPNGYFFICELHPFKQYQGGKARFELNNEIISPDCFTHHASDFYSSALNKGLTCLQFKEWFDKDDRESPPRLISFLFNKPVKA
jgi:ubiquinone/menaquinone biosynthesis C-methylase UbiE